MFIVTCAVTCGNICNCAFYTLLVYIRSWDIICLCKLESVLTV